MYSTYCAVLSTQQTLETFTLFKLGLQQLPPPTRWSTTGLCSKIGSESTALACIPTTPAIVERYSSLLILLHQQLSLGINGSPFHAFSGNYWHHKVFSTHVHDLITAINFVPLLQKTAVHIRYQPLIEDIQYILSVVVFPDAIRNVDYAQLGIIAALRIGKIKLGSIFHAYT